MRAPAPALRIGCERETAGHEPLSARPVHDPVSVPVVGRGPPPPPAAGVDGLDLAHRRPGFGPEGAGVHRQCAAHRSRDAGEELAPGQPMTRRELRDPRARGAGFGVERHRPDPFHRAQPHRGDDGAAHPAVAHQQVAAEPDPQQRLVLGKIGEERRKLLDPRRLEVAVGEPSDPPCRMPGQRFAMEEQTGAARFPPRHRRAASTGRDVRVPPARAGMAGVRR